MAVTSSSLSIRGRSGGGESRVRRGQPGCGRLDRVAAWVGYGVAAAFFASLERCSCINLTTAEEDDEGEDSKDVPLIRGGERRRRGKGKKKTSDLFKDCYMDDD
ncbi:hypothetical protein QJS10_CPB17g02613 [Acorus calamus]|uniref:Uncharacterized protein n=1 Tax=Acorus calamus TaxID=4465 RepID=A0AAV9CY82_ACOCL|nr:hypothetical protein QJS10_CPB17g02613 [Acorus calamus]